MTDTTSILGPEALPSLLEIKLDQNFSGSYFANRGISQETFCTFNLGHVAEAPGTLPKSVLGAPAFPIYDVNGFFAGWIFRPDHEDYKYFYYSARPADHAFGLTFAAEDILKKDEVVIVEGPFDALMAHSKGLKNTVAVLGGCISVQQILLLASYTKNFVLALDSDTAGILGAQRSEKLIRKVMPDVNVRTLPLFPHKDFCDYLAAEHTSNDTEEEENDA